MRSYELLVIKAFAASVSPAQESVLDQQISTIDAVNRNALDKAVVFVWLSGEGLPPVLFENRSIERLAASVYFSAGGNEYRADVIAEAGCLRGIRFDSPPRMFKSEPCQIGRIVEFEDLFHEEPDKRTLADWDGLPMLSSIGVSLPLTEVIAPVSDVAIDRWLNRTGPQSPPGLRELLLEADGFRIGDVEFTGTRGRVIVWPDDNLQMLAERADTRLGLCFRESDPQQWQLLDEEDATYEPLDTDASGAISELVRRSKILSESLGM